MRWILIVLASLALTTPAFAAPELSFGSLASLRTKTKTAAKAKKKAPKKKPAKKKKKAKKKSKKKKGSANLVAPARPTRGFTLSLPFNGATLDTTPIARGSLVVANTSGIPRKALPSRTPVKNIARADIILTATKVPNNEYNIGTQFRFPLFDRDIHGSLIEFALPPGIRSGEYSMTLRALTGDKNPPVTNTVSLRVNDIQPVVLERSPAGPPVATNQPQCVFAHRVELPSGNYASEEQIFLVCPMSGLGLSGNFATLVEEANKSIALIVTDREAQRTFVVTNAIVDVDALRAYGVHAIYAPVGQSLATLLRGRDTSVLACVPKQNGNGFTACGNEVGLPRL